jgi:hypothetical protein
LTNFRTVAVVRTFFHNFVFRLSRDEVVALNRSQFVTGSQKHRDPRFPPYAFTEHGALMAANMLSSPRAVEVSIFIVRAFVRLREVLATHVDLARKLAALEKKYDEEFKKVWREILKLITPSEPRKRPIGFLPDRAK